jgi:hypothetical protein
MITVFHSQAHVTSFTAVKHRKHNIITGFLPFPRVIFRPRIVRNLGIISIDFSRQTTPTIDLFLRQGSKA